MEGLKDEIKAAVGQAVAESRGAAPREVPQGDPDEPTPAPPAKPKPAETPAILQRKPRAIPKGTRRGQIVACADGTEKNISQAWTEIFKLNEKADPKRRLTDGQIRERMRALFPGREESKLFNQVGRMRAAYNSGRIPGQTKPPRIKSFRYDRFDDGAVVALSPRGTVTKVLVPPARKKK